MKLVVNDLLGVGMQALAEALTLGQRAGLNKDPLIDVLQQTSVLTSGQKAKLQNARNDTYPIQFALRLMSKDFANVMPERPLRQWRLEARSRIASHESAPEAQPGRS